jgi:hypothetical protein
VNRRLKRSPSHLGDIIIVALSHLWEKYDEAEIDSLSGRFCTTKFEEAKNHG